MAKRDLLMGDPGFMLVLLLCGGGHPGRGVGQSASGRGRPLSDLG